MGGTGKTPLVLYIAQVLTQRGFQPAILTRGYRRTQSNETRILAPKEEVPSAAGILGDEPAVMRRHISSAWMGISKNRFRAGSHNFPKAAASGFYPGRRFSASQALSGPGHCDSRPKPGAAIQSRIPARDAARTAFRITSMPCYCAERHSGRRRRGSVRRRDCALSPASSDFLLQPDHRVSGSPCRVGCDGFQCRGTGGRIPRISSLRSATRDASNRMCGASGLTFAGQNFSPTTIGPRRRTGRACAEDARSKHAEAIITTEKDAVKILQPPDFPVMVSHPVNPHVERTCI